MKKEVITDYIESSFIKDILVKEHITDISYNGRDICYVSNVVGRVKSNIVISQVEAKDFLRQIANMSEKQFSYLNPILDLNVGKYRINGMNSTVGRVGEDAACTFSIRIAPKEPKILHDEEFMCKDVEILLDSLVLNHVSIVIAGIPGVGKTELQKYLISRIDENERIVVVDSTIELSTLQERLAHDITLWQVDERNKEASVSSLIKNGLRSNPDWMIISEARGEEMNDVLMSAMTGIPIITTIHSQDAFNASNRIAKMVMMTEKRMEYKDVISNINEHFKIYIYLKKFQDQDSYIKRYISSIVEVDSNGIKTEIYHDDLKKKKFVKISDNLSSSLLINNNELSKTRFMKHE